MLKRILNRVEVYSLYCWEYMRYGEWGSLKNAIGYMINRKSAAPAKRIRTSMGVFDTRPRSLDFQYINYAYEIDIKRFIEKEDFEVFLDIGACLGEYCIWLGKKGKKCIAFEPVSASYEMIRKNIALNGVEQNVRAYNYGLGKAHSTEYFELDETNPGSNRRVDAASSKTEKIEINALDDRISELGLRPDQKILIKIDIEGMELDMLRGASNFLKTFPHLVLIIEEKFSGESNIRKGLSEIADFDYGKIDEYNIYARKK